MLIIAAAAEHYKLQTCRHARDTREKITFFGADFDEDKTQRAPELRRRLLKPIKSLQLQRKPINCAISSNVKQNSNPRRGKQKIKKVQNKNCAHVNMNKH